MNTVTVTPAMLAQAKGNELTRLMYRYAAQNRNMRLRNEGFSVKAR